MTVLDERDDRTAAEQSGEVDAWLAGIGFVLQSGEEDGEEGLRWFLCDAESGVPIGGGFPSRGDAVAAARRTEGWLARAREFLAGRRGGGSDGSGA